MWFNNKLIQQQLAYRIERLESRLKAVEGILKYHQLAHHSSLASTDLYPILVSNGDNLYKRITLLMEYLNVQVTTRAQHTFLKKKPKKGARS